MGGTENQTNTAKGQSELTAVVRHKPDWQVTTILTDDLYIETDCNSGTQRKIRKSTCSCGHNVLIEYGDDNFRKDGKRVFYPDKPEPGYSVFRCDSCHEPVHQTVPHAEFGA